jgi:hypothetical protein
MFDWLRRLLGGKAKPGGRKKSARSPVPRQGRAGSADASQPARAANRGGASKQPADGIRSLEDARQYLDRLHGKIDLLAQRFAAGLINPTQFQELYEHYQNEIQTIEAMIQAAPGSDDWKRAVTEGQSVMIRRKHQAQALGFSIYSNESGIPLKSIGQFGVDPALFVPMLSAYRSAAREIFGAGLRSTQIEGGKWLSFIPGKVTTTLALFNTEPSAKQLKVLDELQKLFENANANQLASPLVDADRLVCPHEFFLDHPL